MENGIRAEGVAWAKMHERINEIFNECARTVGRPALPAHLNGKPHSNVILAEIAKIKKVRSHIAIELLKEKLGAFSPKQLEKYLEHLKK